MKSVRDLDCLRGLEDLVESGLANIKPPAQYRHGCSCTDPIYGLVAIEM
jgi:hypothetical protein